jgi:hypothetical protein
MPLIRAEHYDTLGSGRIREANCCWVQRVEFDMPDNSTSRSCIMRAKRKLGISGLVCDRHADFGDCIILYPRNSSSAVSITWVY